ncbi:MAG: diguanylate cyclase [Betaproteobacteria bacterium]|nr:diguanylate cyclase [Betaproteobacteria bacterium]
MSTSIEIPESLPKDEALVALIATAHELADVERLVALVPPLCADGRPDAGLDAADAAVRVAADRGDILWRVRALRARARAKSELAEYRGVVRSLLEAQALNADLDDAEEARQIQSALGLAYGRLGARAEAIAAHQQALVLSRQTSLRAQFDALANLGITLMSCERPDEAVGYFRQALSLAQASGDTKLGLRARINLYASRAVALDLLKRRGEAVGGTSALQGILGDYELLLADCQAAQAAGYEQLVQQHMGIVLRGLGRFAEATRKLEGVLAYAREHHWERVVADVQFHLAGILAETGDYATAEGLFDEVLGAYRQAEFKVSILEAHRERAHLFELAGRFDRAYQELKIHEQIRLQMAASEEQLSLALSAWRDEYAAARAARDQAEQRARELAVVNARLAQENLALDQAARHDALTGLPNRRFAEIWVTEWRRAKPTTDETLALAVIDIDHFKTINDNWSHLAGDAVLSEVAAILRALCRREDFALRQGGDEFLIFFPHTRAEDARAVCERIVQQVAAHDWSRLGAGLKVTVSIGVAAAGADGPLEELQRAADMQLYRAKAAGRNRVAPAVVAASPSGQRAA